jgi:hypothetical protein
LNLIKTPQDFDKQVRRAFSLKDAEWVLIEDLVNVTLPDLKGTSTSPGRLQTKRQSRSSAEPDLRQYCEYFIRVLKAGFGQDKQISATIFQEKGTHLLPFRLVAFQLDHDITPSLQIKTLESLDLLTELERLNKTWLKNTRMEKGDVYYQRVARIYDAPKQAPTIFIIKPDAYRYWTRSMGLHDADEVASDLVHWHSDASGGGQRGR